MVPFNSNQTATLYSFGELLNDEEEVFILGLHEKVLIMIQLTLLRLFCHKTGQTNLHLSNLHQNNLTKVMMKMKKRYLFTIEILHSNFVLAFLS